MAGTVYILGAGASRAATDGNDFSTPLATDFFKSNYVKEFWSDVEFECSFQNSALYFILIRYFSSETGKSSKQNIENINIEEVYSFLHSYERVFQSASWRRERFESAKKQLQKYIITVIRYTSWNVKQLGFLSGLVKKIKGDDSIITFNWDTLVEQALLQSTRKECKGLVEEQLTMLGSDQKYALSTSRSRIEQLHRARLIKVHGSISYTVCINQECQRSKVPFIWELREESPEYWSCEECGSPTEVMILAPHGAKTYSSSNFFKLQATLAAEKLSLASKIVLIGYSFPVFDIEARSMLRCARLDDDYSEDWLNEIVVVNPQVKDRKYISEIKNLLGVNNYEAHGHPVDFVTYESVKLFEEAGFHSDK